MALTISEARQTALRVAKQLTAKNRSGDAVALL